MNYIFSNPPTCLKNKENGNKAENSDIVIQEKKVNLACYENFVLAFLFKAVFTKSKILFWVKIDSFPLVAILCSTTTIFPIIFSPVTPNDYLKYFSEREN